MALHPSTCGSVESSIIACVFGDAALLRHSLQHPETPRAISSVQLLQSLLGMLATTSIDKSVAATDCSAVPVIRQHSPEVQV